MNSIWKIIINSLITGLITMLSTLTSMNLETASKTAIVSVVLAGILSVLVEFKSGWNSGISPPANDVSKLGKNKKGLFHFGYF